MDKALSGWSINQFQELPAGLFQIDVRSRRCYNFQAGFDCVYFCGKASHCLFAGTDNREQQKMFVRVHGGMI